LDHWELVKPVLKDPVGLLKTLHLFLLLFAPYARLIDSLQGDGAPYCSMAPLVFQTIF
jgi:hypothetical protein